MLLDNVTPLKEGDKVTMKYYRQRDIDLAGTIEELTEMPNKWDYLSPCYFIRWDNSDMTYEYIEDVIAY